MADDLGLMIGLEIHCQLKTDAKLFCTCPAGYREVEPNTNICPICTSQPGSKPMGVNRAALENLVKIALALECKIDTGKNIFVQRKHYFYPDLPSNYQRTSKPIAREGTVGTIRIRELHIEEDPGRYELRKGLVDYNRSGVPLVEIVTEPDLRSPEEARAFLEELQAITQYLEAVRDEAGSTRIDANISLAGGKRVEVKNINSYKGVFTALKYEIVRQSSLLEKGQTIIQETRHYDEGRGITLGSRKKETAEDYRYIPDPDIPPLEVQNALVEKLRATLPELPRAKAKRLAQAYGIREDDAWVLVAEKEVADLFEQLSKRLDHQKLALWMRGALKKQLNYRGLVLKEAKLSEEHLFELADMFFKNEITDKTMEELLIKLFEKPFSPRAEAAGSAKIGDAGEIGRVIDEVLAENPPAVADYKKGEGKALNFLAGKAMAKTKGRADPKLVQELLKKKLG